MNSKPISNAHFSSVTASGGPPAKAMDAIVACLAGMAHICVNFIKLNIQLNSEFQQAAACMGNLTRQSE